jgi:hypothetical protein
MRFNTIRTAILLPHPYRLMLTSRHFGVGLQMRMNNNPARVTGGRKMAALKKHARRSDAASASKDGDGYQPYDDEITTTTLKQLNKIAPDDDFAGYKPITKTGW